MIAELSVNGVRHRVEAPALTPLLDVLRDVLLVKGPKRGCDEGQCGACSVIVDGALCAACLTPLANADRTEVETIEGVAAGGELSGLQAALLDAAGVQCGICTPGVVMALVALLREDPEPGEDQVRNALAGNLCRCTGYRQIFDAVSLLRAPGPENAEPAARAGA